MSMADKLRLMETLWDDLCQDGDKVPSPAWHGELLASREARVKHGSAKFSDWEQAKTRIRRRVS